MRAADGTKRRDRNAGGSEKIFLPQPVLRDVQNRARRMNLAFPRAPFRGLDRDVLELERDHIHAFRETPHGVFVSELCDAGEIGELAGRAVLFRREDMHAVAHAPRRDGKHAAELAAAHHANGRSRRNRPGSFETLRQDGLSLPLAKFLDVRAHRLVGQANDAGGEQGGVLRP